MAYTTRPITYAEAISRIKETCPIGFDAPIRNYTADDPSEAKTTWRARGPVTNKFYEAMNLAYLIGKSKVHAAGSVEESLEKLLKNWEMEASNKAKIEDWKTIHPASYKVSVGYVDDKGNTKWQEDIHGKDAVALGNYNIQMKSCPVYKFKDANPSDPKFEESQEHFRHGFSSFPWEILEAKKIDESNISFRFRHWGYWAEKGAVKKANLVGKGKLSLCPVAGVIATLEILYESNFKFEENPEEDKKYPSALAKALKKENAKELTDLFIPKGKTLETL